MEKRKILTTIDEIRAYNDPYRLKIFVEFSRFGGPATCKEIADILGEVPAKIHYHIKKMEKAGILVLAYTKNINGIIAKYYEPAAEIITVENPYLDDNSRKLMTSEISKTLEKVFNNAKDKFISEYEKCESEVNNEKYKYTCMLSELYFTEEEAKELLKLVDKAKNRSKEDRKETNAYSFFMSFIRTK
ncbi:helix-turn-helix transcriptional regulator [Clostridium sp. 19966]|uniref:ArsR/SmtB family transcription factor n=1 Tax=Clostridium sp. 19966 TaxID=2768166 RepID=UPI0028DFE803|nr:helix-turn-helix domain-containing protein [Clostridium sp. 19966]MDT8715131.1 helix-turn-helix transcriptional regulator [Clostridium sp. 19966]